MLVLRVQVSVLFVATVGIIFCNYCWHKVMDGLLLLFAYPIFFVVHGDARHLLMSTFKTQ